MAVACASVRTYGDEMTGGAKAQGKQRQRQGAYVEGEERKGYGGCVGRQGCSTERVCMRDWGSCRQAACVQWCVPCVQCRCRCRWQVVCVCGHAGVGKPAKSAGKWCGGVAVVVGGGRWGQNAPPPSTRPTCPGPWPPVLPVILVRSCSPPPGPSLFTYTAHREEVGRGRE